MSKIVKIVLGLNHAVVLLENATIRCIGDNKRGQCNANNVTDVKDIAAGNFFTSALVHGRIQNWGDIKDPVQKVKDFSFKHVTAYNNHVILSAPDNEAAICFGDIKYLSAHDSIPNYISLGTDLFIQISTGSRFSHVLYEDGSVGSWSHHHYDENIEDTADDSERTKSGFKDDAIQIADGDNHTIVLLRDKKTVSGWSTDRSISATKTQNFGVEVKQITAGNNCSFALLVDGTIRCWGDKKCPVLPEEATYIVAYQKQFAAVLKSGKAVIYDIDNNVKTISFLPEDVAARRVAEAAGEAAAAGAAAEARRIEEAAAEARRAEAAAEAAVFEFLNTGTKVDCAVCLSSKDLTITDDENNDRVYVYPCGHTFHRECSITQKNCPSCRSEAEPEADPKPKPLMLFSARPEELAAAGAGGNAAGPAAALVGENPSLKCSICSRLKDIRLNRDNSDINSIKVLPCGHTFHNKCITDRLVTNGNICPECNLRPKKTSFVFLGGFKEKYLKYKQKYISLKREILLRNL